MLNYLTILAQGSSTSQPSGSPMTSMLFPLVLMGAIFYFLLIRPQGKDRKKRESMIAAIKKNDRVVTIGGVMGTVVSVKDNEITLKVDESNNTKITFLRSAIQQVTSSAESAE